MADYYEHSARQRAPRRLPAGRRGDRAASRAPATASPPGWAGTRRRRSSPATRPRRSTSSPARGGGRTSAPATASSSPRWSTTPTSCRGGCSRRRRARRSRSSASTTTASCSSTSSTRLLAPATSRSSRSPTSPTSLGTINPVADIVARARAAGAVTVIDGAQAVPQIPVDLRAIDADFYAWTGHKAYGPTGVGVLHGRRELLETMPPWLGGGHMIHSRLASTRSRFAAPPARFEAGTSAIAEGIGLGAAVDFLAGLGMETVRAHERELVAYALERLAEVAGPDGPRPARRRPPRRARVVRARRHPPARRRRDPRPRRRLRPRRPPLRPAADEAPGHHAPRPARRSPCTPRARTSTASSRACTASGRSSPSHGRALPREHPRALQAAPQLGRARGRHRRVRGQQPALRRHPARSS